MGNECIWRSQVGFWVSAFSSASLLWVASFVCCSLWAGSAFLAQCIGVKQCASVQAVYLVRD